MVFIFPQQWNIALVVQPFDQSRLRTDPPYGRHCCRCCSDAAWALFFKSPQQQIIAQFSFFEWGQQIQQMESKWWCSSLLLKHCKNSSHKQYEIISGGSFLVSSTSVNFRFRGVFFPIFSLTYYECFIKTPHENAGATKGKFSVDNTTLIHCLRKICHPYFRRYFYQNRSICMH